MPMRAPHPARWILLLPLFLWLGSVCSPAQSVWSWRQTSVPALLEARQLETVEGEARWAVVQPEECAVCEGEKVTSCRACRGGEHGAAKNCAECRGRGESACERCAGTGETLDPFVEMPCPGCWSRSRIPCQICLGVGRLDVVGGGTPSCPTCKAKGGFRCGLCRGTRRVRVLRAGRTGLHEAAAEVLDGVSEQLAELEEQARAFATLARQTRPKPEPGDLAESFDELVAAAAELDRVWRGLPSRFSALEKALERPRTGGVFSMRQLSNNDIRRFSYRDAVDGMLVWIELQRGLVAKSHTRFR